MDKQTVLHCLKSQIDEALCEMCPLYGLVGTDHCQEDAIRYAIDIIQKTDLDTENLKEYKNE